MLVPGLQAWLANEEMAEEDFIYMSKLVGFSPQFSLLSPPKSAHAL